MRRVHSRGSWCEWGGTCSAPILRSGPPSVRCRTPRNLILREAQQFSMRSRKKNAREFGARQQKRHQNWAAPRLSPFANHWSRRRLISIGAWVDRVVRLSFNKSRRHFRFVTVVRTMRGERSKSGHPRCATHKIKTSVSAIRADPLAVSIWRKLSKFFKSRVGT
jgi:hypothetical protein